MEKITLVKAIHDLKTSFRKYFGHTQQLTPEIEQAINLAAARVKKGEIAEWYEDQGVKIRFTRPRRWRATPQSNRAYGARSNPTARNYK